MALQEKLAPVKARYEELAALMAAGDLNGDEFIKYSREYAELGPVVEAMEAYEKALEDREGLKEMLDDPEMKEIAAEEMRDLDKKIPDFEQKIKLALIPKDSADEKDAILEIRAGTGGDEAALFAADLFSMYRGLCCQPEMAYRHYGSQRK